MNAIRKFIQDTLTGGILFMIPVLFLYIILSKVYHLMTKVTKPIASHLPDYGFGLDGKQILTVLAIVFICFIAGIIIRSRLLSIWVNKLEDSILSLIPGYTFIMSKVSDILGKEQDALKPVLVQEGDVFQFGFLMDEQDDLCTVYIAGAPDYKSGEVKIFASANVKKLDVSANKITRSLKQLGKSSVQLIPKH
ncbi:MAG: hypothetical protein KA902_04165 [Arenimonas sp.]|nr:hypothetical protein [Arenimonas sp.]